MGCTHTYTAAVLGEANAALREENARLRQIVKWVHGALTDAGSVVVPGTLEGDLAPAVRQLTRERDEARAELLSGAPPYYRKWEESQAKLARCVEALANVDASDGVPEYVRRNVRAALAAVKGEERWLE